MPGALNQSSFVLLVYTKLWHAYRIPFVPLFIMGLLERAGDAISKGLIDLSNACQ
jgi:hypothetical protein